MTKLTHYIIHCTATPKGMEISADALKQWHLGPAKVADGFRYKGNVYSTVEELPREKIGGVEITKLIGGRGWRQVGYADMIHLDGQIENLVPYNENSTVDPWEITNGILQSNPIFFNARHMVYVGGMDVRNKKPIDTRTPEQMRSMLWKITETLKHHPDITIAGHNQFDNRACPSFNVPKWLLENGVRTKNDFLDAIII